MLCSGEGMVASSFSCVPTFSASGRFLYRHRVSIDPYRFIRCHAASSGSVPPHPAAYRLIRQRTVSSDIAPRHPASRRLARVIQYPAA